MTQHLVLYHAESDCLFAGPNLERYLGECTPIDPSRLPAGARIEVAMGSSEVLPSLDFETYSEAGYRIDPETKKVKGIGSGGKGGLPVVGTPVYAEHPSAEILSLAYDLKDGYGRRLWVPGAPFPLDLLGHVRRGGLLEAWNATFEFYVWNMIAVRRFGWPALPIEQMRCAMAKSRRFSLPGSLGNAAKVLGAADKLPDGKRLIQKLTRPHTPTKKRPDHRWIPATAPKDFNQFYAYNLQDVAAEDSAAAMIPDLTPQELAVWQADQRINVRGIQVDVQTLDAALSILGQAERKYTRELVELTDGAVGSISEIEKMSDWLRLAGVNLPNLQADTVSDAIASLPDGPARRVLQIREGLGSANVKKLRSLRLQISSDGRLRDQYTYCGADRTGRWSSGGVQLQNLTSKGPKTALCNGCWKYCGGAHTSTGCPRCGAPAWSLEEVPEWQIQCAEQAIEDIRTGSLEFVEHIWLEPITTLCGILRALFTAAPGKKLVCVDFSAIEAVVLACLSRCQWRIDVFATHGKIYEMSASRITGRSMEEYEEYKRVNGMAHPDRKKVGKVAELASGYQGWVGAWRNFGADGDDQEIKQQILAWREASPEIVEFWGGEYKHVGPGRWDFAYELHGLEGMAMRAIMEPGVEFTYIDITYFVADDILYCRLPSGRLLHYHRPRLEPTVDKLNRGPAHKITFEGYNSNPQKGPIGWHRKETYGGMLTENVVQAVARDIQAEAILRLEAAGYPVVLHTHDECCAEVPDNPEYNVESMVALMSERPTWASWWPIKAAGWEHYRYQKD